MTNAKTTRRALLTSVMSLILCCSMLLGTTFAWFTDTVTSANNIITAGNLDIELSFRKQTETGWEDGWTSVTADSNIFKTDTLWEPGHTEVVQLKISNVGTLALKYQLGINVVEETQNLVNVDGTEFKLSDHIYFGVTDATCDTRAAALAAVKASATKINVAFTTSGTDMLKAADENSDEDEKIVTLVVYMPESIGNEANYRGDVAPQIKLGLNLFATQVEAEKDSFDEKYDADAAISDAIFAHGGTLEMKEDINDQVNIPEDVTVTINAADSDTSINNAVINNGNLTMNGGSIEVGAAGLENHGNATLSGVTMNAGSASDYSNISYSGAVTVYDDTTIHSGGGGVGAVGGGKVIFNSGSVDVNSTSTSGRYLFYTEGAGSEITINGGNFDFDRTQNQKRAYIYAGADTTVYVKGGTFGKASTRSGYTAGILGDGKVIITGGTFGFDPTTWVAPGYQIVKDDVNGTWTVSAKQVANTNEFKNAIETINSSTERATALELGVGNYATNIEVAGGKDVVIDGAGEDTVLTGQIATTSSTKGTITLRNLTINVSDAIQDSTGISQTSKSAIAIWGNQTVICENVTFNMDLANSTAITSWWDTGVGTTIIVRDCTFNCNGQRPIRATGNVTVENCVFNDPYRYAVQLTAKASTATELQKAVVNFNNNTIVNGENGKDFVYGIQLEGADYGCHDLVINGSGNTIENGGTNSAMYYCECGKVDHATVTFNTEVAAVHAN